MYVRIANSCPMTEWITSAERSQICEPFQVSVWTKIRACNTADRGRVSNFYPRFERSPVLGEASATELFGRDQAGECASVRPSVRCRAAKTSAPVRQRRNYDCTHTGLTLGSASERRARKAQGSRTKGSAEASTCGPSKRCFPVQCRPDLRARLRIPNGRGRISN